MIFEQNRFRLVVTLALIFSVFGSAQETRRTTVAMLDVTVTGDIPKNVTAVLSNVIREEFIRSKGYQLLDRNNMEQILKEQDFTLSDACSGQQCAVEVGKLLGVERMLFGTIGSLGKKYLITLQIVDVTSGTVVALENDSYVGALEDLDGAIRNTARKVVGESKPEVSTRSEYEVYVTSEPEGAAVFVNDDEKGNTPLLLTLDNGKKCRIKITADGFQDWFREVKPTKGERMILPASLLAKPKDNLSEDDKAITNEARTIVYESKKKSHATGIFRSAIYGVFGGAHWYTGAYKRAILLTAAGVVGISMAGKNDGRGVPFIIGAWGYDLIGGQFAIYKTNQELKKKLKIAVLPDPSLTGGRVTIAWTF